MITIALYILAFFVVLEITGLIYGHYAKQGTWWTIKKGRHYSSPIQHVLFWLWWGATWKFTAKKMDYTVKFDESCKYDVGKNQHDWNKLPGFQRGFDKTNRWLNGWRYSPHNKYFETCMYWHSNNEKPGYTRGVYHSDSWQYGLGNPYKFATPLFFHFGGNKRAPHTMKAWIKYEVIR